MAPALSAALASPYDAIEFVFGNDRICWAMTVLSGSKWFELSFEVLEATESRCLQRLLRDLRLPVLLATSDTAIMQLRRLLKMTRWWLMFMCSDDFGESF